MSTHNMFLLRNKKDISIFRMKKAPYLLLCDTPVLSRAMLCVIVAFIIVAVIERLPSEIGHFSKSAYAYNQI